MENTFTIVLNDAIPNSWPDMVWTDAKKEGAKVYLDYCRPMNEKLRKLRKIHFSNSLNRRFWMPLKCLWDKNNALRLKDLDPHKRNYIIFQTGIKFSAHSIKRLKKERNACIVLYMPDNIRTMGIANNKAEFDRYCRHFHIDQMYSFDKKDCEEFGMEYFDFYSKLPMKEVTGKRDCERLRVLYVGSCRSKERLATLHGLYDKLKDQAECAFYLNDVRPTDMRCQGIIYNHPLTYLQVVDLVQQNDVIVEIMNGNQTGNTLRFKESVCYNKLLLTNNHTVKNSSYYDNKYVQIFDSVNDIELSKFNTDVQYNYQGEYSPTLLLKRIIDNDKNK